MVDFLLFSILEIIKGVGWFFFWFFLVMIIIFLLSNIIYFIYDKFKNKSKEGYVFEPIYIASNDFPFIFEIISILTEHDEPILNKIKDVILNTEQFEDELQFGIEHFICSELTAFNDDSNTFMYGVPLDWKETIENGIYSLNDI